MKPLTLIIVLAFLSIVIAFIIFAFKIKVTFLQLLIILILVVIMGLSGLGYLVWLRLSERPPKGSKAKRALEYAKNWWWDYAHEHIDVIKEARGGLAYLPGSDEKYYGWVFRRLDGEKVGQPLVLIVSANPLDYAWHDDDPSYDDLADPFHTFFSIYSRAPGAKIMPEAMPWWRGWKRPAQTVVKVGTKEKEEEEFIKRKKEEKT